MRLGIRSRGATLVDVQLPGGATLRVTPAAIPVARELEGKVRSAARFNNNVELVELEDEPSNVNKTVAFDPANAIKAG